MGPSKYWIKLYHEILHDPKMGRLPDNLWRRTIELFLMAGELDQEGELPPVSDMAWTLRTSEQELEQELEALAAPGLEIVTLTPSGWVVTRFADRQSAMSSAERVRRHRESKRKEEYYGDETEEQRECNDGVTNRPTDSDTDIDSDIEKERASPAPARADSRDPTDLPPVEAQMPQLFPKSGQQACNGVELIKRNNWHIHSPDHLQAVACFLEASRLPVPFDKSARKDWLKQVDIHLNTYGLETLRDLYPPVIAHMRGDGVTVSRPGSVTNNLASYWAEHKNGGKHARPTEQRLDETSQQLSAALEARTRSPGPGT